METKEIIILSLTIFETIVRLKPTKVNLSLIDLAHKIVNIIIPNKQKI